MSSIYPLSQCHILNQALVCCSGIITELHPQPYPSSFLLLFTWNYLFLFFHFQFIYFLMTKLSLLWEASNCIISFKNSFILIFEGQLENLFHNWCHERMHQSRGDQWWSHKFVFPNHGVDTLICAVTLWNVYLITKFSNDIFLSLVSALLVSCS